MRTLIIPCGGNGDRMSQYFLPKCLLPVKQRPMLFSIIDSWKPFINQVVLVLNEKNKDIIIAYVKKYHKSSINIDYCLQGEKKGTYYAIKKAIELSNNKKIILNWSDVSLYNKDEKYSFLDVNKKNIVFTTNVGDCRWKFTGGKFFEGQSKRSKTGGIYGIFIVNDIDNLFINNGPNEKPNKEVEVLEFFNADSFIKFNYEKFIDIGTPNIYNLNVRKAGVQERAFGSSNNVYIYEDIVIKKTASSKFRKSEENWYKNAKFDFIPRVFSYSPLVMENLSAEPVFKELKEGDNKFETEILSKIFDCAKKIHKNKDVISADFESSHEQYFLKTIKRLENVNFLFKDFKDGIIINGKKYKNPLKVLKQNEKKITNVYAKNFRFIHGDIQLSNALIDKNKKIFLIDPRGYFGKSLLYGDPMYDFAKIYYGFCGIYDKFSTGENKFIFDGKGFLIEPLIKEENFMRRRQKFIDELKKVDYAVFSMETIDLLHAIIWLSVTDYIANDALSCIYAYLKGTILINDFFYGKNK